MEIKLDIPPYRSETGVVADWEDGFEIAVNATDGPVLISANKAGLISLAIHLLALAQDDVPIGCHFHFDEHNSLEDGSKELIIGKSFSINPKSTLAT
jgi:hypothetical protein